MGVRATVITTCVAILDSCVESKCEYELGSGWKAKRIVNDIYCGAACGMQATNAAKKAYGERRQALNSDKDAVVGLWNLDLFYVPGSVSLATEPRLSVTS